MPIKFSFEGTDVRVLEDIEFKNQRILAALQEKMEYLMNQLQRKIQSKTLGRVQESIRNPEAHIEGNKVVGSLQWGGEETTVQYRGGKPYDIARILNEGAKLHAIEALGVKGELAGQRQHKKGGLGKRLGASVLIIPTEGGRSISKTAYPGKEVIFREHIFHPGIHAEHFIEDSVDEMREQFRNAMKATLKQIYERGGR